MRKIYQKPFPAWENAGFTLIELLVVVLIIGILAAVALPQYEVAVEKSRLAAVMRNVKTIKMAADLYFMANGRYEDDMTVMDVGEISGCTSVGSGQLRCGDKGWYDWKLGYGENTWAAVGYTRVFGKFRTAYVIYGDYNKTHAGEHQCWAQTSDAVAMQVCRSMGGVEISQEKCIPKEDVYRTCTVFKIE